MASKVKKVAAAEIRAAKKWLERRDLDKDISPRMFATAAKTLDKGFKETLKALATEIQRERR